MARAALAAAILVLFSAQDKGIHEFKWSLAKDLAADYTFSDLKGGKAVPLKDRSFVIYGSELLPDGGSTLMVNSYEDLGPYFLFMLPKGKVKVGSKWTTDVTLFKDARLALTPMHCYKELNFVGGSIFKKLDKVQDRECALIDSVFQYFEIKIDTQGRRKPAAQPMGTLRLTQWLSLGETELLRGSWEIKGRDQEYKGIKQGEEPKGGSIDAAHVIELKKDYIKLDLLALNDFHGNLEAPSGSSGRITIDHFYTDVDDIDGDGKLDVCGRHENGIVCYRFDTQVLPSKR